MIIKFLDSMFDLGIGLNYVLMDRELYQAEFLDEIKGMKGNVFILTKSHKKIKQIIIEYLQETDNSVRKYMFSSALGANCRFFQNVYMVLNAKKAHSLLEV